MISTPQNSGGEKFWKTKMDPPDKITHTFEIRQTYTVWFIKKYPLSPFMDLQQ